MKPHAVPERRPNVWVAVFGLVGYIVVAAIVLAVLWGAAVLLFSMQPASVAP